MKISEKIKNLIQENLSFKKETKESLNENIKVFKTEPKDDGYTILISSDSPIELERTRETAKMGKVLSLKKGDEFEAKFKNRHPFARPTYWSSGRNSGVFGWGYKITSGMPQEQADSLLKNLKELVHDYNTQEKTEFDLDVEKLTPDQVRVIGQISDAIEASQENTSISGVKRNLLKYLLDLQEAVEKDEVYEFLIETFEKTKNFQKKNLSFYKYSFLNSLIIRHADPDATYATPKSIWFEKGYGIKPEFKSGIAIQKMGTPKDTTWENANWFKDHGAEWNDYKSVKGLPAEVDVEKYLKGGGKTAAYELSSYGLRKNLFSNIRGGFTISFTYTDTMIEPIPGKEQVSIDSSDFSVAEEPIESMELKDKIDVLFDVVSKIGEKEKVNILGVKKAHGDIGQLNNLISKVATEKIKKKYGYMLDNKMKTRENEEVIQGYSEIISHIIRKHYDLPAEMSKYKIAGLGVDKEKMKQRSDALLNIANYFIDEIDAELANSSSLEEVRYFVRKTLLEHLMKK